MSRRQSGASGRRDFTTRRIRDSRGQIRGITSIASFLGVRKTPRKLPGHFPSRRASGSPSSLIWIVLW